MIRMTRYLQQLAARARSSITPIARAPPTPVAQWSRMEGLPTEILVEIFEYLSMLDCKNLRLCSKRVGDHAICFVFRSVHLSITKTHLNNFLAISKDKGLSKIPRQLVWYECDSRIFLSEEESIERRVRDPFDNCFFTNTFERPLFQNLARRTTTECLWRPLDGIRSATENSPEAFQEALAEFFKRFVNPAMLAMPNVRSFVYRPWPFHLALPGQGYPFSGGIVGRLEDAFSHELSPPMGLFVMSNFLCSRDNPITSLHWEDRVRFSGFCGVAFAQAVAEAFKNFTTIDLCLTAFEKESTKELLADCLLRARRLEKMTLCFEKQNEGVPFPLKYLTDCQKARGNSYPPHSFLEDENGQWIASKDLATTRFWSNLSSLKLVDMQFFDYEILGLFTRHAGTLRDIALEECLLLHRRPQTIRYEEGDWRDLIEAMATAKRFNLRSIRILQRTGDSVASFIPEDDILQYINKNGACPFSDSPSNGLLNTHQVMLDSDFILPPDSLPLYDHPAKDAGSRAEAWEPVCSLYWTLRRVMNHVVWWHSKDPESGGYETELWRFERSDGSFAYGEDPYDYFSDWGSELGYDKGDNNSQDSCDHDDCRASSSKLAKSLGIYNNGEEPAWREPPSFEEDSSVIEAPWKDSDEDEIQSSEEDFGVHDDERVEEKPWDLAIETPFGPSFEDFCNHNGWGCEDPAVLEFPKHAVILLNGDIGGMEMSWHGWRKDHLSYRGDYELCLDRVLERRSAVSCSEMTDSSRDTHRVYKF